MQSSLCKEDLIVTTDQDNGILLFQFGTTFSTVRILRYCIKSVNSVINESSVKPHFIGSARAEGSTKDSHSD